MNYKEHLKAEVLKRILEGVGQVGHPVGASATANGHYPVDNQKFKGELPDEEPNMHDDDPNAEELLLGQEEELYEQLFQEFEADRAASRSVASIDEERKKKDTTKAEKSGEKITISLPKFVPNESWGKPDSEDFQRIRKFVLKATGAERDIKKKFDKLMRPFESDAAVKSPGRMISAMILLESLASILNSFGEAPAGFVFEGFLAALTFGRQENTKTPTGLPIEDIIQYSPNGPNGVPASLKVLSGRTVRKHKKQAGKTAVANAGTGIHGSYQNLIYFFDRYDKIEYIIALKRGAKDKADKLQMFSFWMTRKNIVDVLTATDNSHLFGRYRKEIEDNKKSWTKLRPYLYMSLGYDKGEIPKAKGAAKKVDMPDYKPGSSVFSKDFGTDGKQWDAERAIAEQTHSPEDIQLIERLLMEKTETQWTIEQKDLPKISGIAQEREIAELDLSTDNLRKQNQIISAKLGNNVKALFGNMEDMSNNINDYFTTNDRAAAKSSYGPDAVTDANSISSNMDGIYKDEKKSPKK